MFLQDELRLNSGAGYVTPVHALRSACSLTMKSRILHHLQEIYQLPHAITIHVSNNYPYDQRPTATTYTVRQEYPAYINTSRPSPAHCFSPYYLVLTAKPANGKAGSYLGP
jgi:hypothetical protein